MKLILILAALSAGTISPVDDGYPPVRYQGDATISTTILGGNLYEACGVTPVPGFKLEACSMPWENKLVLPNPCDVSFAGETFARLACHELGHLNGWPGDHPRP
jgi:hypothetical protein